MRPAGAIRTARIAARALKPRIAFSAEAGVILVVIDLCSTAGPTLAILVDPPLNLQPVNCDNLTLPILCNVVPHMPLTSGVSGAGPLTSDMETERESGVRCTSLVMHPAHNSSQCFASIRRLP